MRSLHTTPQHSPRSPQLEKAHVATKTQRSQKSINKEAMTVRFPAMSSSWGRRQWQPTPVLLPGESHGWRSLVGCGPRGQEESDMTERLRFHFSLSCIGEGNGNPLQCSCLENPRDRGAWWAADYGVAQSQTQLKRLSSSSSSSSSWEAYPPTWQTQKLEHH